MFWNHIGPLDWGFVILVPLIVIYFIYHIRKGWKDYCARVAADEDRVRVAFLEWLQNPSEETEAKADAAIKGEENNGH